MLLRKVRYYRLGDIVTRPARAIGNLISGSVINISAYNCDICFTVSGFDLNSRIRSLHAETRKNVLKVNLADRDRNWATVTPIGSQRRLTWKIERYSLQGVLLSLRSNLRLDLEIEQAGMCKGT
jgi:hypothetical protein